MPPLDDNFEDQDSSSDLALDVKTDADKTAKVTDANSSNATGETDDLLNVVRDVVKDREPSQTASPAEGDEDKDQDATAKKDDEDYSDVPFNQHPRFQHLVRQKNALRAENEHLKVDAGRYQNVQNFLDSSGLTPDEAANGLTIMAMAKVDPAKAWQQLKPWVQSILIAAGEVLPDDLKKRVDAGEITGEVAMELSRARAEKASTKAAQTFHEQREERRKQAESADALKSAAQAWEDHRRARDPNFAAKYVLLQKEIAWRHQNRDVPTTPQAVKDQLADAYKVVNEAFRPAATPAPARKPAIRPIGGGQVADNVRAEPKSVLDVVRANRRRA